MSIDYSVEIQQFREILNNTSSSDFDGHTEFSMLSSEDRLMWLSQSSQFAAGVSLKK